MSKLEYLRRSKGISQVELSRQAGIHPASIAQVERHHRRAWPKLRAALASSLNVSESELFDESGSLIPMI
ncbi:hypothetical protein SD71_09760 [Cohnella kolymensis]|uniref:HTH cro/C1-type domain-containing protein n=1 Tax=Cohnella kolymensis TaxID=1590652 RepID=A0ABR5A6S4_9BACL|nr:hypothetical protein SD71_09760 [Cohnella kolymensis]